MRKRILLILTALISVALSANAQPTHPGSGIGIPAAVDATHLPPGVLDLGPGWRTQTGDNLAWAQPSFDDRSWASANFDHLDQAQREWRWYRLRVHLGVRHPHERLLLAGAAGLYELYLNGSRIPGTRLRGIFGDYLPYFPRAFPLPDNSSDLVIALRTHAEISYTIMHVPLFFVAAIGVPEPIANEQAAMRAQTFSGAFPTSAINLLMLLAGLVAFSLWCAQRSHTEYLWLGLYFFLLGTSNLAIFGSSEGVLSVGWNELVGVPLIFIGTIMQIQFTFSFAGRRVGRTWRVYEALLLGMTAIALLVPLYDPFGTLYLPLEALAILPTALLLPVLLSVWYRKGNREAGWLILPSVLPAATLTLVIAGAFSFFTGWGRANFLDYPIVLGPVHLSIPDIGSLLFLFAIAVVMFFRFTRVSREQARAAAELEAAQKVQSLLVHSVDDPVNGWRIATVYRPAGEVSGDFYNVQPLPAGAALIVVGDVSGKGVEAALRVAAVVGALRETAADTPASVLKRLNAILLTFSQGSFTTCLCARIAPDGTIALANAGHLAPYRNGEEVPLEPGLPLGIAPDTTYTESTIQLAANDQLTFLSDGVVEAQSPTGELFGFGRTAAISTQSAEEIARAAQVHGQQDDITVLTLTFAPAEVAHA